MNFCNLMKKTGTGKNTELSQKKPILGKTYMKYDGCHGTTDMNEGTATESFQNFEKL